MNNRIRLLILSIFLIFLSTSCIIYNFLKLGEEPENEQVCSGYTYSRIIREQQRILRSVRQELLESQANIEEIRAAHEELLRLIPQKQAELSKIEGEIEAAVRLLEETRQTQNVRVFLPYSPVSGKSEKILESPRGEPNFEDIIDFGRCSISSFLPIHVSMQTNGTRESTWLRVFRAEIQNLVDAESDACLTIRITNGEKIATKKNLVIFNVGANLVHADAILVQKMARKLIDFPLIDAAEADAEAENSNFHVAILPATREFFINFKKSEIFPAKMQILVENLNLPGKFDEWSWHNSKFCIIFGSRHENPKFLENLANSLRFGCVPVILSTTVVLPFEEFIDWRLATYRIPLARLPELHFILKSIEIADFLEMKRMGQVFWRRYLATKTDFVRTLLAALRYRLVLPSFEENRKNRAQPAFQNATSFSAPILTPVSQQPKFEEDYSLGPLEPAYKSPQYLHNFTQFQLYSYSTWNVAIAPHRTPEYLIGSHDPPAEAEFFPDSASAFRPIFPGSGTEFNRNLGGNRHKEQFTVVLLTFERDAELKAALERLNQLPYLNKILVIWNNINRVPSDSWPSLHVPIEFIKVAKNSLNNRFIPWNRIETEAVLSLDDDIDLMQEEFLLAFRVWRENRDRIVGFPARYHARYGEKMYYNSNHTCQMSIILTGAAFLHKNYLDFYTYEMPAEIRRHVDEIQNCEDIAMNFLVAHLTRKPPIKTTSRWTIKCPTCAEKLSDSDSHFSKRHECIRLFTTIYGYNPLRFSQFRADSILFKTRLPETHQKCYKYV
ncbi:unnamed protein product [Caenorhabditis angaria]|uniref:Uncharacterized protein n=1 Tax=Caenorhabditis angaria TaxID=860376 RepID=A0A9P1IG87_9PELO|nr:unnamed protein product [Caenorhabditis angaria]